MKSPEPTTIKEAMADLRARGYEPTLVWGASPNGDRIGPVPDDWADIFADTEVPQPAPRMGYRGTRGRI